MSLGFWMVSSQIWSRHFWLAIFGRAHIWSNPYLVLTHIWSKLIFGRGHIWTNQIWSVPYLVHPNLVCAEFGAGIRGPLARGSYHKGPFLKILWPKDLQNQRTFGQKDLCTKGPFPKGPSVQRTFWQKVLLSKVPFGKRTFWY